MEIGIKFIKQSFQLIPSGFRSWGYHQKIPTANEKNTTFFSTFQSLSNQESASRVSVKKSTLKCNLLYKDQKEFHSNCFNSVFPRQNVQTLQSKG